ncbi:MAG: autotransporter outer membrane beta-barrel domain-containing protein [Candidatus Accumulibacter sp.]|nr:autotransporter outer membrane beta-barrel domain-containing protein [Accumulibacter sp.]
MFLFSFAAGAKDIHSGNAAPGSSLSRPAPARSSGAAGDSFPGITDEPGVFHDCAAIDIEAVCLPLDGGGEIILIDADAPSDVPVDGGVVRDGAQGVLGNSGDDKSRVGEGAAALDTAKVDRDEDFFTVIGDGRGCCESGSRTGSGRRLITGLTGRTRFGTNRFAPGAWVIHGTGGHEVLSRFTRTVKVRSRGDTRHTGPGLLARLLDLGDTNDARAHVEASARAGREKIFYSRNLKNAAGRGARYNTHAAYVGLRLGVGRVWNIRDRNSFTFYGKYLYAHLGSDSVRLGTGDPVKFDAIESQRLRFGGRYSWMLEKDTNPYVGLAWEREFDGKTAARSYGLPLDAPNVRGNTDVVELGLSLCPTLDSPLSIELDIRGYGSGREGISGGLRMEYRF